MEAKTLNEAWEEYDKYNTITKDEYNIISTICQNECETQHKIDIENALEAFCKVCGYKGCAERDIHCQEYKDFERLLKE